MWGVCRCGRRGMWWVLCQADSLFAEVTMRMEQGGQRRPVVLCVSTYEKGQPFLREMARLGAEVLLLTVDALAEADWPREVISQLWTMPADLTAEQVLHTVTYRARWQRIDAVVALDEFDLETAALLREHLQLPGGMGQAWMGVTGTRLFRDKLAMRVRAKAAGVRVPEFTGIFDYERVREFLRTTGGPWLLKPRTNASAVGISKIYKEDELWPLLDRLGDQQSHYLLERFVPGEIFHCEGVTWQGETLFALAFQYGQPPMQTMHEGGVFTTRVLERGSDAAKAVRAMQREILRALGLKAGVTHTELIRAQADGEFYFLETAARVGGAYIAEVVEFATGLNPWVEWARLEWAALQGKPYELPRVREEYAGSVISLAKQAEPDTAAYDDAEIVMRLEKTHHAGLVVKAAGAERVKELVETYSERFLRDFCAVLPVPNKPTS